MHSVSDETLCSLQIIWRWSIWCSQPANSGTLRHHNKCKQIDFYIIWYRDLTWSKYFENKCRAKCLFILSELWKCRPYPQISTYKMIFFNYNIFYFTPPRVVTSQFFCTLSGWTSSNTNGVVRKNYTSLHWTWFEFSICFFKDFWLSNI